MQMLYFTDICLGKIREGRVDPETFLVCESLLDDMHKDVNCSLDFHLNIMIKFTFKGER